MTKNNMNMSNEYVQYDYVYMDKTDNNLQEIKESIEAEGAYKLILVLPKYLLQMTQLFPRKRLMTIYTSSCFRH